MISSDFDAAIGVFQRQAPLWHFELKQIVCRGPYSIEPGYFFAEKGRNYYFRIAGEWNNTGNFTFSVDSVSLKQLAEDLDNNNIVDFGDFIKLSSYWLYTCPDSYWCQNADINQDGIVNISDYVILTDYWMQQEN